MRKILLTILCGIILPTAAIANAQWHELTNNGKAFYIDTASMLQNGSQYTYWIKSSNSKGYTKLLMVSDCSTNLTGVQKSLTYNNGNKLINSKNVSQELSIIVPDSNASIAYNYVCSAHKAQEQQLAEQKIQQQQQEEKNKAMQNLINTGLGVGLYFLGK